MLVLIPCFVGGSIAQAPCIWWTYNPKHDTHELTFPCQHTDPGTWQRESLRRNQRHHRAPSKDMFSQESDSFNNKRLGRSTLLNHAQSMKMHETSNTDLAFQEKNLLQIPDPKSNPIRIRRYWKVVTDISRSLVTGVFHRPAPESANVPCPDRCHPPGSLERNPLPQLDRLSSHLMPPASNIRGILCG